MTDTSVARVLGGDARSRRSPVQVWVVDLAGAVPRGASQSLSKDELRRAGRFIRERDRSRWIGARSALRHILSRHIGVPPHRIDFTYGRYGKPSISKRTAEASPAFNLSHAGDLAIVAVGTDISLGVDIERCPDRRCRFEELAPVCLSDAEHREMSAMARCARERELIRIWTCKEAYLKATGRGLSIPPHLIETRSTAAGTPELVSVNGSRRVAERWSLRLLRTMPGYTGALAIQSTSRVSISYSYYARPE